MKLFRVTWTDVTKFGHAYGVSTKLTIAENKQKAIQKYIDGSRFNVIAEEIDVVDGYRVKVITD